MIPDQVPSPGPNVEGNPPNGGASSGVPCTACGMIVGPSSHSIVNAKGTYCSMGCAGSASHMTEPQSPVEYVP